MTFLTSRTAVLTFQDCPRRRFLAFHAKGSGISGSKLNLDTFIGTVVHRGLQNILEHARVEHDGDTRTLNRTCINKSIEVARTLYFSLLENSNGIMSKADDYTPYEYKVEEAWYLSEALMRSYMLWRLPQLGEFYEVLEVEKEEEFWFEEARECSECKGIGKVTDKVTYMGAIETSHTYQDCFLCKGSGEIGGILFQAKADGLLRGRQDNHLYPLSFKTARDFTDLTMKQILHDMQGMSEIAAIENRLDSIYQKFRIHWRQFKDYGIYQDFQKHGLNKAVINYFVSCVENRIEHIECHAVQYEYLLKGRYQQDPWNSGIYKWQNPLIHCWKNDGMVNMFNGSISGMDYKWKPGQGRQPKGWAKIDIWEDMGIEKWIDTLMLHEIQPEEGDVFQNYLRGETIFRSRESIEEWKISTHAQESEIRDVLLAMNRVEKNIEYFSGTQNGKYSEESFERLLQKHFRKHTNRCHDFYGNDCPFIDICHNGITIEQQLESGAFKPRSPHHEIEREEFKKKGYIE